MADPILTNADLTIADDLAVSQDGKMTVHGTGTFDDLMEAVTVHVDAQFRLGRLKGSDYAAVYTASMQAAMGNAVQYLLGRGNAELIAAQVLKVNAEIELIEKQGELADKQMAKIDAEISLLQAKENTEAKQVEVLEEQAKMIEQQGKGFLWSANQKYFKTIVDGQAVNANIEGVGITDSIYSKPDLEAARDIAVPVP